MTALQFYVDLVLKHKVVPPEAMTWEFDEIIAGGQNDRYAMTQTFAPYGTLINDPQLSKTAGRWAWATVPGHSNAPSRTWIDGHFFYSEIREIPGLVVGVHSHGVQQAMDAALHGARQRAAARSVLRDPAMVAKLGWPPVAAEAIETGFPTPAHPVWDAFKMRCGPLCRKPCLGKSLQSRHWMNWRRDWQRNLRRAGIGR